MRDVLVLCVDVQSGCTCVYKDDIVHVILYYVLTHIYDVLVLLKDAVSNAHVKMSIY